MRNSWPRLFSWNKETLYSEKNCSYRLNTVNYKEKMFFLRNNYSTLDQSFPISCYFSKIFVHLLVIAAVCYLNVYKLTGWKPANIYLLKVNSRNTRKRCEIYPKLTINTVWNREHICHFFKCFYCWLGIGKCLSWNSLLCKHYYSDPKDEQKLYFCNIVATFLNS